MTTTPKSVILAVVIFLGLIVLAVIGATLVLQLTGNGPVPGDVQNLGLVALGALGGVLASTKTTPELPPGAQLTGGATTLTTPTTAQNDGDTAGGTPIVVHLDAPAPEPPLAAVAQTMDHADPSTIPGYSTPVPSAPPITAEHQTAPIVSADQPQPG